MLMKPRADYNEKQCGIFLISGMFLCTVLLCTCVRDVNIDSLEKEKFLENDRVGFYIDGEPVFLYVESIHQKAVNAARGVFRFQTDVQDTCLNVTYKSEPRNVGVHVLIDMDYIEPRDRINLEYEFECSRITGSKIWLWDSETKNGMILPRRK